MRSWADIDRQRQAVGLSRSELCRQAGISESTFYKGLKAGSKVTQPIMAALAAVLQAAKTRVAS